MKSRKEIRDLLLREFPWINKYGLEPSGASIHFWKPSELRKVYFCTNCGRKLYLAKHRNTCPYCGGTLKVIFEKK